MTALPLKNGEMDTITLDNLRDRLPAWRPDQENHLYAIVDMGSNGIRFSITDLSPPQTRLLKCLYRERAAISLFDALQDLGPSSTAPEDTSSHLGFSAETITLVVDTLARFHRVALEGYSVPPTQFIVLATEALRRACNGPDLVAAIRASGPAQVHVLRPEAETLLGAVMGARSAFREVPNGGAGLFLDMGGGSAQMTWVDTGNDDDNDGGYAIKAAREGVSLPYGAAKLIGILMTHEDEKKAKDDKAKKKGKDKEKDKDKDKKKDKDKDKDTKTSDQAASLSSSTSAAEAHLVCLRADMRSALDRLCTAFPSLQSRRQSGAGVDVYLCGGGFRGYGSILMHTDPIQPWYPIPSVGTYTTSGALFSQTDRLRTVNAEYEGKIFGMSSRRRGHFGAVAEVVDALVGAVSRTDGEGEGMVVRSVTFCQGSNRDGALMMMLPASIRESDPLAVLDDTLARDEPSRKTAEMWSRIFKSAIPANLDLPGVPTIFSLGLGPTFAREVWTRQGDDDAGAAAGALRSALGRDPGAPGLTHLARAVYAIAMCARWGTRLGPADKAVHDGLVALVERTVSGSAGSERAGRDAAFYARYVGAVAAAVAVMVPVWDSRAWAWKLEQIPRLEAHYTQGHPAGKRPKIILRIDVDDLSLLRGIDVEEEIRQTVRVVVKKKKKNKEKKEKKDKEKEKGDIQSDVGVGVEVIVNGASSTRKRDG